jgi:hypothetical protein
MNFTKKEQAIKQLEQESRERQNNESWKIAQEELGIDNLGLCANKLREGC